MHLLCTFVRYCFPHAVGNVDIYKISKSKLEIFEIVVYEAKSETVSGRITCCMTNANGFVCQTSVNDFIKFKVTTTGSNSFNKI